MSHAPGDLVEPRPERTGDLQGAGFADQDQERGLERIVRVVCLAEELPTDPPDHRAVAIEQRAEGKIPGTIPTTDKQFQELGIRIPHRGAGCQDQFQRRSQQFGRSRGHRQSIFRQTMRAASPEEEWSRMAFLIQISRKIILATSYYFACPGPVPGFLSAILNGFMLIPLDHLACLKGKTKIWSPCWTVMSVVERRGTGLLAFRQAEHVPEPSWALNA